jgi:hypothetical protein
MLTLRNIVLSLSVMTLGMLGATAPASAADAKCHSIHAQGEGESTSPLTTTARITGGGILNGSTAAVFTPTTAGFTGPITFHTNSKEIVVVTIDGTLTGAAFHAQGAVTSGTGKFQNSTGSLIFDGVIVNSAGDFTETVTGNICLQK